MRVEVTVLELAKVAHCCSEKVLKDLLVLKGLDPNKEYTVTHDHPGQKLIAEQED